MSFRTATKGMGTGVGMLILAVVILGGVVLGGWAAGWWFTEQNTTKRDQVYDKSYGRQQALRGQITDNITLVFNITAQIQSADAETAPALIAQRKATVGLVCRDAAKINESNPLDRDQAKFVSDNCTAGAVSPSSIYFK